MKRTEPGTPKLLVIEVGPITSYGFGPADVRRMEREMLFALDSRARDYMRVGPRSNVVRSRIEEA